MFVVVPTDTMYLTGSTNQQLIRINFLFKDLDFCIRAHTSSSLSNTNRNHFMCIDKQLFHCLLRGIPDSERRSGQIYCGSFSLNQHRVVSSDILLFIEVIKGHILHHALLEFNFETSPIISCVDHGLTVSHRGYRSMNFCGRRVPWTMIVLSDKSYLHLVIQRYLHYEIAIFYSSFHKNWIRHILRIKLLQSLNDKLIINRPTINHAQYYVFTGYNKHIYLSLLTNGGSIIVYDGPGRLSNTILDLNNSNSLDNTVIKTSAYWAFVDISSRYSTQLVIEIKLHFVDSTNGCYRRGLIHVPQTSKYRKNVVCSDFITHRAFVKLAVKNFVFDGPDKLIDTSSSLCQYGGFYIKFYSDDKWFEFCQDINDLDIYSRHNGFYITLVWFYGYSRGYFTAKSYNNFCQTLYIEQMPRHIVYQTDISIRLRASHYCQVVVCPPMFIEKQKLCTLQLGPPSLGPTSLKIKEMKTLQPCDTRLKHMFASYKLDVNYDIKWPFALINTTSISRELDNNTNVHNYDFLNFAKVKMTLMCNKDSPRKQIAFYYKTSVCEHERPYFVYQLANSIPALSDKCLGLVYGFVAEKRERKIKKNHHLFIYKGDGHITTGHEINVEYEACPAECRNYNYSVFVRSAEDKTVMEYTAQVGHVIFTGYYHRGFGVHINIPKNYCRKAICHLALSLHKSERPIGTDHYQGLNKYMPFFFTNKR